MSKTCSRSLLETLIRLDPRWRLFTDRWPGWRVRFTAMEDDEIINWSRKTIWLNCHSPDPIFRAAHAVAHLKLHRNPGTDRTFTAQEESEASWLAMMWLAWTQPQVERAELTTGEN